MRITVFGSTGHVGRLFVHEALAEGHTIVAYARSPQKLASFGGRITVVRGDLSDAEKICAAVQGADAVVSVLGPVGLQRELIFTPAYRIIIAAMKTHGVKRLIALGTPTIRDEADRFNLIFEVLIFVVGLIINKGGEDIATVGALVRESGLDYTLVRIPLMHNGTARGITIGAFGAGVWWPFITRADFVEFLLSELTNPTHIRKVIAISN